MPSFVFRSLLNFYPRSPCGERPPTGKVRPWASHISIHALLAESDGSVPSASGAGPSFLSTLSLRRATQLVHGVAGRVIISIHALLAESDWPSVQPKQAQPLFLSTLSLRRATLRPKNRQKRHNNFYPRSPCGERLQANIRKL